MSRARLGQALDRLPPGAGALTRAVLAVADKEGVSVLLVGGPVRDLLLGRPLVDVDLLVEDPDPRRAGDLAERLASETVKCTRHDRFGTARLDTPEASVDLASMRSETYAHPGALPTVAPGDLEADLARRDFGANALALPLSAAARAKHPEIIDLQGGLDDLAARRLRVLHARSFHDDPTRALRAARLAPRLGFHLARRSRTALRDALREGATGRVSADRLRREFVRVFEDAARGLQPAQALRALDDWHVLGALEPGLRLDKSAVAPLRRLGRAVAEPPWSAPRWRSWMTGLGLWLGPLPAAQRRRALRRLGVRGAPAQRVGTLWRDAERAGRALARARGRGRIDALLGSLEEGGLFGGYALAAPALRRLGVRGAPAQRVGTLWRDAERAGRALARARGRGRIDALLGSLEEEELFGVYALAAPALRRRVVRYAEQDRGRRPPVSGTDLAAAGLSGPDVGRALERIRIAWLDGGLASKEEALALGQEVARRRVRKRKPKATE